MTEPLHPNRFAGLDPAGLEHMLVAWRQLAIPGPLPAYQLRGVELTHPDPRVRFARRIVACMPCADGRDTLALVDKASPHSLFDLMLTEVSAVAKSTPVDVAAATGRALWRTGGNFVRFCSQSRVVEDFGLAGGELHLALNCDPHTVDRESVQAAKQFHLHLLCWTPAALAPLAGAEPLARGRDARLRRQALDPISFLGARLICDALSALDLGLPGAGLLPPDDPAVIVGKRPLGCVIRLPGWSVLGGPDFEVLIRRIHVRLATLAADLLECFTGEREPPPPWQRHPLLPRREISARILAGPFTSGVRDGLECLAAALRPLAPRTAARLARASPAVRTHLMTLNHPAYALNLHAPRCRSPAHGLAEAPVVHLIIQPRLFSGIGGAGLLTLGGVPSVRILRGQGTFSLAQWQQRARFQRAFACFNRDAPGADAVTAALPIRRFVDFERGWV